MINGLNIVKIDEFILGALREDISSEDVTTNAVIREDNINGRAELICKEDGVLAGIEVFKRTFHHIGNVNIEIFYNDGDNIKNGDLIAVLTGDIKAILVGERTALNYLQRMSGIATYTKEMVKELEGYKTKLLDTRKIIPNIRVFGKYVASWW